MFVPVHARLLDEGDLIDAALLELPQMAAQVFRRADAAPGGGQRRRVIGHFFLDLRHPHPIELLPEIGPARLVLTETIEAAERIAEELEAEQAALHGKFPGHDDRRSWTPCRCSG